MPLLSLNVVMPMAGGGKRLAHLGHKPLIEIGGRPMVEWAVKSLGIEGRYIFVVQKAHEYELMPILRKMRPDCIIIPLHHMTQGAAETVLAARRYIDSDVPLVTANCDQYLEWTPSDFIRKASPNGSILTYTMTEPDGSFCILDDEEVVRVAEKEVISNIGTVGVYHFGAGKNFVKAAEKMIQKDIRVNGEFYLLPVYNELIAMGLKPNIYHLPSTERHVWRIGIQRELDEFLDYQRQ